VLEDDPITELLIRWSNGDQTAREKLMPLVYHELHQMARSYLRGEQRQHTLQPTALVHETYLRLVNQKELRWQDRAQFYGLASTLIRNILVDYARQQQARKRGGEQVRLTLQETDRVSEAPEVELIALDQALQKLTAIKPQHSRVVELRFFGGLSLAETAAVLGVSHATVERNWSFARAWLRRELAGQPS
jgi:RNA polymerase sigma-70 factor, ECF subfamily